MVKRAKSAPSTLGRKKKTKARQTKARAKAVSTAQVTAAAKKAAAAASLSLLESKYFDTTTDSSLSFKFLQVQTGVGSTQEVTGLGYSTTVSNIPNSNTNHFSYPDGESVKELHLARVFTDSETDPLYKQYQLDGTSCTPMEAHTTWKICRVPAFAQGIGTRCSMVSSSEALQPEFARYLPIKVRMVRVVEKTSPGIWYLNNPRVDLFLNQYGKEYGIDTVGFSSRDAEASRLNRRRYTVIDDKQFVLEPGASYNYEYRGRDPTPALSSDVAGQQIGGECNSRCEKLVRMNHQITTKKGGKLHYNDPQATTSENPSAGHRREYIFFHAWWMGMGPTSVFPDRNGTGDNPVRGPENMIYIGCTPRSTFKDT